MLGITELNWLGNSFELFYHSHLKALINARGSDPNLKEKLRDSNRHLPWIKTVKERHGSVETSSLQQVEAINRFPYFLDQSIFVLRHGKWGCFRNPHL